MTTFKWLGWVQLQERLPAGDSIVVTCRNQFSRNFEQGVAIQTDLTQRENWIVAIRENIDAGDDNAGAEFNRCMMLAQGAYEALYQRPAQGLA